MMHVSTPSWTVLDFCERWHGAEKNMNCVRVWDELFLKNNWYFLTAFFSTWTTFASFFDVILPRNPWRSVENINGTRFGVGSSFAWWTEVPHKGRAASSSRIVKKLRAETETFLQKHIKTNASNELQMRQVIQSLSLIWHVQHRAATSVLRPAGWLRRWSSLEFVHIQGSVDLIADMPSQLMMFIVFLKHGSFRVSGRIPFDLSKQVVTDRPVKRHPGPLQLGPWCLGYCWFRHERSGTGDHHPDRTDRCVEGRVSMDFRWLSGCFFVLSKPQDEHGWTWMNMDEHGWTWMNMNEHGWTWMNILQQMKLRHFVLGMAGCLSQVQSSRGRGATRATWKWEDHTLWRHLNHRPDVFSSSKTR